MRISHMHAQFTFKNTKIRLFRPQSPPRRAARSISLFMGGARLETSRIAMAAVCAFLLVLALAAGSVSAIEKLSVTANRDGSYSVIADGSQWLQSGAFRVRHEEKFWGPDLGNMVGAFSTSQGSDEIGSYTSYEYTWTATAGSLAVTTYVTDYDDMPVVMFSVQFTSGANATNFTQGDSVRTVSSWPSFAIEEMQGVKRGYVTWSGNSKLRIQGKCIAVSS